MDLRSFYVAHIYMIKKCNQHIADLVHGYLGEHWEKSIRIRDFNYFRQLIGSPIYNDYGYNLTAAAFAKYKQPVEQVTELYNVLECSRTHFNLAADNIPNSNTRQYAYARNYPDGWHFIGTCGCGWPAATCYLWICINEGSTDYGRIRIGQFRSETNTIYNSLHEFILDWTQRMENTKNRAPMRFCTFADADANMDCKPYGVDSDSDSDSDWVDLSSYESSDSYHL